MCHYVNNKLFKTQTQCTALKQCTRLQQCTTLKQCTRLTGPWWSSGLERHFRQSSHAQGRGFEPGYCRSFFGATVFEQEQLIRELIRKLMRMRSSSTAHARALTHAHTQPRFSDDVIYECTI